MKLAITVDVEEEGLFCGRYETQPLGVNNVQELHRLEFIPVEFGFPVTLLVTYAAACDPLACRILSNWRERYGAEIGAHLHPWNTPPFGNTPLWEDKLGTLLQAIQDGLGVLPTSFRMGRFELTPPVISVLRRYGLVVDSSMVPLRQALGGPDQFLTPAEPFWLYPPTAPGPPLLEVPLTVVAWSSALAGLIYRLSCRLPSRKGELLRRAFAYVGAAGPQPTMFPLFSMRHSIIRHRRRGGQVITMYLHSSELLPGGSPQFPDLPAVQALVNKIRKFLNWLLATGEVTGITLTGLFRHLTHRL